MDREIIQRGAEAVIYKDGSDVVKDRVAKGYRLPELDARIRKQRTRGEAKLLDYAARSGINVPRVNAIEDNVLRIELIDGRKVKDVLNEVGEGEREGICRLIGEAIAKMHAAGIAHGDFTTSNMIIKGGKLYVIDFGFGKMSARVEDEAVDLYLLYEALKAAHFKYLNRSWQYILQSYKEKYAGADAVLQRFGVIEKRRRYKGY